MGLSNGFICLVGIATVFVGLISIILICSLMGAVCKRFVKEESQAKPQMSAVPPAKIENKQEIIAAVTCAIAEELGTDIKGIRVKSFKRI